MIATLDLEPSLDTLGRNLDAHRNTSYLGREILMGRAGTLVLQVYGLSGRSQPSRDREFVLTDKGVRTAAPGKSEAEMAAVPDADLIYYQAMEGLAGVDVVSNGAQTIHIANRIAYSNLSLSDAVRRAPRVDRADGSTVDLSSYEPDSLHTPRIAGVVDRARNAPTPFGLSIISKALDSDEPMRSTWVAPTLGALPDEVAYGIRTYRGVDGSTDPFDQGPYPLAVPDTAEAAVEWYIEVTDPENLVAVVVKEIDLTTGGIRYVIKNGLQPAA